MKHTAAWILPILLPFVGFVAPAPAQQDARGGEPTPAAAPGRTQVPGAHPTAAPPIGIVDFERVKAGVPRWETEIENLRAKDQSLHDEIGKLQQQVRDKELKRDTFEPNTLEHARENAELQGMKQALQSRRQEFGKWIERMRAEVEDRFIREFKQATAKVAAERGLLLVLRVRSVDGGDGLGERLQAFALNDVVYHAPTLDLTEDVIRILKAAPAGLDARSGEGATSSGGEGATKSDGAARAAESGGDGARGK